MGRKPKRSEYFWTSERCYILELLNSEDFPEVSLARTRVESGVTTQQHALSVHEVYVIESGIGMMFLEDRPPFEVRPGDVVSIPRHASQRIRNTGLNDLVFLCICTPRFSQNCYTSLE